MKSPMTWEIPVKGTQAQDQLMSKKLLHKDTLLIVKRLVIPFQHRFMSFAGQCCRRHGTGARRRMGATRDWLMGVVSVVA